MIGLKKQFATVLIFMAVLLFVLGFVLPSSAQSEKVLQTQTATSPVVDQPGKPELTSPGLLSGKASAAEYTVTVDPQAVADALSSMKKEAVDEKKAMVAVHVVLAHVPSTKWERLESAEGKHAWRLAIASDGAKFIRPHFSRFEVPEDTLVVAYGEPVPGKARQVKPGRSATSADFWGPVIQGDKIHIEVVTQSETPPEIIIDKISHGIRELVSTGEKESWCYSDPTCYSAWNNVKTAVGQLYVDSGGGGYVCSGGLVQDTSGSFAPWFMTANHCISTGSEAASSYVTWNYHTSVCNGAVPDYYSLPYSAGASLKYTSGTIDVTLILLDQNPPGGTTYLGWTTSTPSYGDDVTVIHHPSGAWKRISFADVEGTSGNYISVQYNQSSTEGGSSGAPLMNAQKMLIGNLSSGDAACNYMNGTDDYGKFASAWSAGLSAYLDNGNPDDDDDDDDLDCGDECTDLVYSDCTCDPTDPCGWSNDGYCDETDCLYYFGFFFNDGDDCDPADDDDDDDNADDDDDNGPPDYDDDDDDDNSGSDDDDDDNGGGICG